MKYDFDTNLIISGRYDPKKLPNVTYISSVVHFELITSCNDVRERRAYELSWRINEKVGRLLVPRLSSKVKQEIAMDCLLAMSAACEEVIVLTLNLTDFDYIKRHCPKLKVQTYPTI